MQVKAAWVWWPAGHSSWREIETQNSQSKRDPYARWRRLKETPMPTFGPHRCTCTSTCTHELPHTNMYTHQALTGTHTPAHMCSPPHTTQTLKKKIKNPVSAHSPATPVLLPFQTKQHDWAHSSMALATPTSTVSGTLALLTAPLPH